MKIKSLLSSAVIVLSLSASAAIAADLKVKITSSLASVDVMHNGKKITIMRNQDNKNEVNKAFAKTSRNCPPFCINPMQLAPGCRNKG